MQEQSPEEAGGWCVCVLVSNPDPLHLCPKLCVCLCVFVEIFSEGLADVSSTY